MASAQRFACSARAAGVSAVRSRLQMAHVGICEVVTVAGACCASRQAFTWAAISRGVKRPSGVPQAGQGSVGGIWDSCGGDTQGGCG